jgi:hypothetical protein
MIVTTGFGFYKKDDKIIMKYEFPIGEHPDPIGFTVTEVTDKQALDAVQIDVKAAKEYNQSIIGG